MRLINLALKADPNFALAYTARARLYLAGGDFHKAKQDFATANTHRERLSAREALTLDTGLAEFGPVEARVDVWKSMVRIYPDFLGGSYNLAFQQANYQQQYAQALNVLKPTLVPQNPFLANALHLAGVIELAMDHIPSARGYFERAQGLGSHSPVRYHADTYAVTRQFDRAENLLADQVVTGMAGWDLEAKLPKVTYAMDRGDWQAAVTASHQLSQQAEKVAPLTSRVYRATWLGLRAYRPDDKLKGDLRTLVADEMQRAMRPDDPDAVSSAFAADFGASTLARLGEGAEAKDTLTQLRPRASALGYPALDDMVAVLEAEIALQDKQIPRALEILRSRVTGTEIAWVHAVQLRAYLAGGSVADARREAEWLSSHRGREYAELNSQYLMQPMNVAESDLALLTLAELDEETGEQARVRSRLDEFRAAWKNPPDWTARRVASVQDWLTQRKQ